MDKNEQVVKKVAPTEVVKATPSAAPTQNRDQRRPSRDGKSGDRGPRRDREKQFQEKVIAINRVSKTVKGGRRLRFSALVALGDGKGLVGFGNGKANEVPDAIKKAMEDAKKNMVRLSILEGNTIPHEIIGKYGACSVFLKPANEGTGIVAGGPVRAIMELAGIKNIYSKVYGSRTSINMVRATMDGILHLKSPSKIAALRGKSIKDIK